MGKIKLLFVVEELDINGAMISLLRLLKNLPKERYDISLFIFNHGGKLHNDIPEGVKVLPECLPYKIHRIPSNEAISISLKKFRPDLILYRALVSLQRRFRLRYILWPFLPKIKGKYDVAICYNDGFVAPTILRKVKSLKKVAWIHITYSDWGQQEFIYDALKKMDCCVPVSIEAGKDLDSVLKTEVRKYVVHNITDAEECILLSNEALEKPCEPGILRIVSVGRVTPPKKMELYPETARILKERGLKFEWFVIGDGNLYHSLVKECKQKNVDDCLHFIGSRANCMPWMKSADVIVNTSGYEAWGMTVSEALCLGKAVITSDIPVFAEQITDGENGIMCELNPESIANAIIKVLIYPELRHKLERNALNYPFNKDVIINEFNSMVYSVLKEQ